MKAGFVTRVEKNVDQAASVLFGVACGYSAYLGLGAAARMAAPLAAGVAGAIALLTYVLSFRSLSAVQPESRKLPVRSFRLREVEPLDPEDFDGLEPADLVALEPGHTPQLLPPPEAPEVRGAPELTDVVGRVAEAPELDVLLLTDCCGVEEPKQESQEASDPFELELTEVYTPTGEESAVEDEPAEFGPESRVVRLFDAAAMPTPGQLGSHIDRHLHSDAGPLQSAEAAQALQDALAELRRSIPSRRG